MTTAVSKYIHPIHQSLRIGYVITCIGRPTKCSYSFISKKQTNCNNYHLPNKVKQINVTRLMRKVSTADEDCKQSTLNKAMTDASQ